MTKQEINKLIELLNPPTAQEKMGARLKALSWVENQKPTEEVKEPKSPRTLTQNKAMWKQHQLVADELTKLGVTMRSIFQATDSFDVPPTKDYVHEIWLYFQKLMFGIDSTTLLPKTGEHFQKVHDIMMKNLGEKFHMEYIDFPHDDKKAIEQNQGYRTGGNVADYYNDNYSEPKI